MMMAKWKSRKKRSSIECDCEGFNCFLSYNYCGAVLYIPTLLSLPSPEPMSMLVTNIV